MKFKSLFVLFILFFNSLFATQIKDLANVIGVRDNQLIGYGLVVGLNGSGDGSSSEFTIQSISNMLQTVNVKVSPDDIKSKNTAAVMVTAKLPPFARQGDKLDITISSIGDAKSLLGGTLLMTALKGVDGEIYALGQGPVAVGANVSRRGGNHPTVATMMAGATVEKSVVYDFSSLDFITLSLKNSSFDTANSIQNAINSKFKNQAKALDPKTVKINKPMNENIVKFIAQVLDIDINYKPDAKVLIDERTGTIVSGVDILVDPVVISNGDITLKITPNSYEEPDTENPDPSKIELKENMSIDTSANSLNISESKTTVANVTRALSRLGANPKQIITILENLKRVGAIHVPLEVI